MHNSITAMLGEVARQGNETGTRRKRGRRTRQTDCSLLPSPPRAVEVFCSVWVGEIVRSSIPSIAPSLFLLLLLSALIFEAAAAAASTQS